MRSVAVTGAANQPLATPRTGGTRGGTTPARPSRGQAAASPPGPSRASGRGFGAYKNAAKETAKKDSSIFQVSYDKTYVIAFLENENYESVWRHWVEIAGDDGRMHDVPRNCIRDDDNGVTCPLCGVGVESKPVALFNVVDLDEPTKVLVWEASSGIFDKIVEMADELAAVPEDKGGPLELCSPGVYAAVSKKKKETKSGKGGFTEYTVKRVKERDLDEDYEKDPVSDDQFTELMEHLNDSEGVKFNTVEELEEIAANLGD